MDGAVLEWVLIDKAVEVLFECAGHFGRSTGARAIPQALGSLSGKTLHPLSQGGIGEVEGGRNGFDVVACNHLTDRLRTAKNPGLLGLFEHGF
jgi:hypothetical protein